MGSITLEAFLLFFFHKKRQICLLALLFEEFAMLFIAANSDKRQKIYHTQFYLCEKDFFH
jgi:hypothetical protein